MATIEERAIVYRDGVRSGKYGTTVTDAYIQGATEQRAIDEDLLREVREMLVDKACKWLNKHDYSKSYSQGCYTDIDALVKDFRKAMEE